MNGEKWAIVKNNRHFNVNIFRRGLLVLVISLGVNSILGVSLFYVYLSRPERDFYATNGATPPIKLTPISAPNGAPQALLPPDPPTDNEERLIPY